MPIYLTPSPSHANLSKLLGCELPVTLYCEVRVTDDFDDFDEDEVIMFRNDTGKLVYITRAGDLDEYVSEMLLWYAGMDWRKNAFRVDALFKQDDDIKRV